MIKANSKEFFDVLAVNLETSNKRFEQTSSLIKNGYAVVKMLLLEIHNVYEIITKIKRGNRNFASRNRGDIKILETVINIDEETTLLTLNVSIEFLEQVNTEERLQ